MADEDEDVGARGRSRRIPRRRVIAATPGERERSRSPTRDATREAVRAARARADSPTRERPLRARPDREQDDTRPADAAAEQETPAPSSEDLPSPRSLPTGDRRLVLPAFFAPRGPGVIYLGLLVTVTGFSLLAFTWGRVAGIGDVAFQVPYLVSGGFTGVGLVLVGLATVGMGARRREAAERARQMERLAGLLTEATAALAARRERRDPTRRSG